MLLLQVCIEYRPNKQQKHIGIKTPDHSLPAHMDLC
jgi:hypothetical protein